MEKEYSEKYKYGILQIENIIKEYETCCKKECGSSPVAEVSHRIKSAESIAEKLHKKGYEVSAENAERYLCDLAGVRIVCFSEKDVYDLAAFLKKQNQIAIIRCKDYIKKPKENGYRSFHLIAEMKDPVSLKSLRVEIQIRTQAMHCWAEMDHRLCYKSR